MGCADAVAFATDPGGGVGGGSIAGDKCDETEDMDEAFSSETHLHHNRSQVTIDGVSRSVVVDSADAVALATDPCDGLGDGCIVDGSPDGDGCGAPGHAYADSYKSNRLLSFDGVRQRVVVGCAVSVALATDTCGGVDDVCSIGGSPDGDGCGAPGQTCVRGPL